MDLTLENLLNRKVELERVTSFLEARRKVIDDLWFEESFFSHEGDERSEKAQTLWILEESYSNVIDDLRRVNRNITSAYMKLKEETE